jgi:hypothetical protein
MKEEFQFTDEARRLLQQEAARMAEELQQEAFTEALTSRGEPVEVTASDVRKARSLFVKSDKPIRPVTDFVLRVYATIGVLTFVGAILYPFVRKFIEQTDSTSRVSAWVALTGLIFAGAAWFMRVYLESARRLRSRTVSKQLVERMASDQVRVRDSATAEIKPFVEH